MTTTTRPEALITTPAEACYCKLCDRYGATRYEGDEPGTTFAHCPSCGSTDLFDQRSPFEVLAEARRNLEAATDPNVRFGRYDVVERVERIAAASECSCSDCASWRRVTGFPQVVPNYDLARPAHKPAPVAALAPGEEEPF